VNCRQLLSLVLLLVAVTSMAQRRADPGDPANAVVRIIGEGIKVSADSLGTGFFISPDGSVLTCYHVIVGVGKLVVVANGEWYRNVLVTAIAPDYDLATLQVQGLRDKVPFLAAVPEDPAILQNRQLKLWGNPSYRRGAHPEASRFFATTTSQNYVRAGSYRDPSNNKPLFARDIDLISVGAIIYKGVSGGPAVDGTRAVGVLSGSINEGGTEGWLIPMKYLANLHHLEKPGKNAAQMAPWPVMTLMSNSWDNLRSQAALGPALVTALDRHGEAFNAMLTAYDQAIHTRVGPFRAELIQLQTVTKDEIAKHGRNFPIERDKRVSALFNKLDKEMDSGMDDDAPDPIGDAYGNAFDNLNTEFSHYMARLPKTAKNLQLEKTVREARHANHEKMLALVDSEEKKMDAWMEEMEKKAGGDRAPTTLGDLNRYMNVAVEAMDEMVNRFDPGIQQMIALSREDLALIELIWNADQ